VLLGTQASGMRPSSRQEPQPRPRQMAPPPPHQGVPRPFPNPAMPSTTSTPSAPPHQQHGRPGAPPMRSTMPNPMPRPMPHPMPSTMPDPNLPPPSRHQPMHHPQPVKSMAPPLSNPQAPSSRAMRGGTERMGGVGGGSMEHAPVRPGGAVGRSPLPRRSMAAPRTTAPRPQGWVSSWGFWYTKDALMIGKFTLSSFELVTRNFSFVR
jgi:hypothetical protein